ncbi:hypothetical protein TSUD_354580 [Trifolium subterraneum]|uniref:Uncharacterized protein n=1 Tax=Trifolium subterraneum TaxID=3900 RepID=A0A2Z6NKY4_TRISU|nr:hypothetical protein TSUD_354580 [Trifolium subterraneum]
MLSLTKRLHSLTLTPFLFRSSHQLRSPRPDAASHSRRRHKSPPLPLKKSEERSEWWIVDGEMHEIGDHVPPRERFIIPRENIPNKRRKQLREQFMRRTRLVLKESVGYSNKLARDHANYESAEDDDEDFSPYRNRRPPMEYNKDLNFVRDRNSDTWEKVNLIRDKFEYDRERRMREKG